MSRRLGSNGFSAVEVVVVLVIVAVLGLGGFFVWQRSKDDDTPKTNTSQNNKNQNNEKEAEEPSDPSEGGKYLVIEEWGVRFPLPEDLRGDVTYGIETSSDKQTAWFEVGKVAELPGSTCKLADITEPGRSGKTGGIGAFLIRTSSKIPENETGYYYTPATNLNIGAHWYTGGLGKQSDSCVNNEQNQQLAADAGASITYYLEYVEATPQQ